MKTKIKSKSPKISKNARINQLIEKYPEIIPVLMGYGLHCVGCHFSQFDTLKQGAKIHGFDEDTFNMMLKDINSVVKNLDKD